MGKIITSPAFVAILIVFVLTLLVARYLCDLIWTIAHIRVTGNVNLSYVIWRMVRTAFVFGVYILTVQYFYNTLF